MAPTVRGRVPRRPPVDPDIATSPAGSQAGERRDRPRGSWAIVGALACGGAVGAVARDAVSLALPAGRGQFPWGTFAINVTGSFALGLLLILLVDRFPRGRLGRPVLGTGFLGAYTTFSTFMVDAVQLVHDGEPATAAAYVALSLVAGLVAVWLGITAGRASVRAEHWLRGAER